MRRPRRLCRTDALRVARCDRHRDRDRDRLFARNRAYRSYGARTTGYAGSACRGSGGASQRNCAGPAPARSRKRNSEVCASSSPARLPACVGSRSFLPATLYACDVPALAIALTLARRTYVLRMPRCARARAARDVAFPRAVPGAAFTCSLVLCAAAASSVSSVVRSVCSAALAGRRAGGRVLHDNAVGHGSWAWCDTTSRLSVTLPIEDGGAVAYQRDSRQGTSCWERRAARIVMHDVRRARPSIYCRCTTRPHARASAPVRRTSMRPRTETREGGGREPGAAAVRRRCGDGARCIHLGDACVAGCAHAGRRTRPHVRPLPVPCTLECSGHSARKQCPGPCRHSRHAR